MNFEKILNQKTEEVNQVLDFYLTKLSAEGNTIYEAMIYSIKAGGKRLRPMMLLETCRLFEPNERVLQTAACFATALEMIHTYSLVHDDLPAMDNDQYRRGMLTTHAKYGEAFGILTGDALLNEAFYLCSKDAETLTEEISCPQMLTLLKSSVKSQRVLAEFAGKDGMIRGQELDLSFEGKQMQEEQLMLMYELKTSRLLEAAFLIGAILGNATVQEQEYAYRAASALGRAFQLRDDMLDLVGDEQKLGKPVNSDLKNEKSTYVSLEGFEKTEREVVQLTEEAIACLENLPGDKKFMKQLMLYLVQREY